MTTASAGPTSRSLLDPDTLRRVLRDLQGTDIDELEVVDGSSRLYLRRDLTRRGAARRRADSDPGEAGVPIVAPVTGVFYLRPSPEEQNFVSVGDVIVVGQVVGLIETMKLFNEVTAEAAGQITSIQAHDGELVEAGQPLLYVTPSQEGAPA